MIGVLEVLCGPCGPHGPAKAMRSRSLVLRDRTACTRNGPFGWVGWVYEVPEANVEALFRDPHIALLPPAVANAIEGDDDV